KIVPVGHRAIPLSPGYMAAVRTGEQWARASRFLGKDQPSGSAGSSNAASAPRSGNCGRVLLAGEVPQRKRVARRSSPPDRFRHFTFHIRPAEPDVAQHAVVEAEERLALPAALAPPISKRQCTP